MSRKKGRKNADRMARNLAFFAANPLTESTKAPLGASEKEQKRKGKRFKTGRQKRTAPGSAETVILKGSDIDPSAPALPPGPVSQS